MDQTHEIVGTDFNQYRAHNKEPYQNYLARNLFPSVSFSFEEAIIERKRIVMLIIPAASEIPTSFKEKRYIRIGSSKVNLKDYPQREIQLFKILDGRMETIESLPASDQWVLPTEPCDQKNRLKNLPLRTNEPPVLLYRSKG